MESPTMKYFLSAQCRTRAQGYHGAIQYTVMLWGDFVVNALDFEDKYSHYSMAWRNTNSEY